MRFIKSLWLFAVLMGLSLWMPANADEIRPALLDIKEQNTGLFAVTWKVPTRGDRVLALTPQLPESLELLGSPTLQDMPGARIEHATYKNNHGSLTGQTIAIAGLSALQTDVLLLVRNFDGRAPYAGRYAGGEQGDRLRRLQRAYCLDQVDLRYRMRRRVALPAKPRPL